MAMLVVRELLRSSFGYPSVLATAILLGYRRIPIIRVQSVSSIPSFHPSRRSRQRAKSHFAVILRAHMAPFGVLIAASAAKAVLADIRNSQFGEEIWRVPKQLIVLFSSFDLFEIVGKFWLSRWRQLSLGAPWELLSDCWGFLREPLV